MSRFVSELAQAVRSLARSPGFTALVVLCLGLGLGALLAIFAVFRGVVLEPLPYAEPQRLVVVWNELRAAEEDSVPLSGHEVLDLAEQQGAFEDLGVAIGRFFNLTDPGEPERLWGVRASASFFSTLGVTPVLGRGFSPEEDRFGADTVVLLSHGLWQRRFGGRDDVLGEVLTLDGRPAEVIGVLPEDFRFYDGRADLWVPVAMNLEALPPRAARGLLTVARLAPGTALEAARAETEAIGRRFQAAHPDVYPAGDGYRLRLVPLEEEAVGPRVRTTLAVLLGAVALVLLIAVANAANLLLARATVRGKEVAIRSALGASRGRLALRFLAEGLVLSGAAVAVGLLLAWGGVRLLLALAPEDLPRLATLEAALEAGGGLDPAVVAVGVAAAAVLGILLALVPALTASGERLAPALREGGKTSDASGAGAFLRDALVVAEIAVAVVVLVGAGLALETWRNLEAVDPGFEPDGVLSAQVALPFGVYRDPADQRAFFERLVERLAAVPAVEAAGAGTLPPLAPVDLRTGIEIQGLPAPEGEPPRVSLRHVTPGWLDALGVPRRAGRGLDARDGADGAPVVLVDETLARRRFGDRDPVGERLRLLSEGAEAPWRTVVGVVGAVHQGGLGEEVAEHVYVPHAQLPFPSLFVALRTAPGRDPLALVPELRAAVADLDSDLPLAQIETLAARRGDTLARERFQGVLLSLFALVALGLSGLGVYGVMAYSVARRRRELGVRMALGASGARVLGLVVRRGLVLAAIGVGIGLALAFTLSRVMESLLHGVSTTDVGTFAGAAALLLALGVVGSLGPALRAVRVDPLIVLR